MKNIKKEIDQLLLEVINCSNACCIECADNRKRVKKLFDKYEKAVEEKVIGGDEELD